MRECIAEIDDVDYSYQREPAIRTRHAFRRGSTCFRGPYSVQEPSVLQEV